MSLIRKAKRSNIPLKLGVSGPSGSGKTYSSILLAKGLMGGTLDDVCFLDSENQSADLYSHLGAFSTIDFKPPYGPQRYIDAIAYAEKCGVKCLIIDSTSHEWIGTGGCVEIHSAMTGNSFQNWGKIKLKHNQFIEAIKLSPMHIICARRRKQEYSMDKDSNGRTTITKMGMKEEQAEGFEYDLTLDFDIQINHMASASKDRTMLFKDGVPFQITEATGKTIRDWNNA